METPRVACDHDPMPATRVLDLAGSCNLRDFGGYDTARRPPGASRPAVALGRAAPADTGRPCDALQALPLRAVCDLRRTDERRAAPEPGVRPRRALRSNGTRRSRPRRSASVGSRESASIEAARAAMVRDVPSHPVRAAAAAGRRVRGAGARRADGAVRRALLGRQGPHRRRRRARARGARRAARDRRRRLRADQRGRRPAPRSCWATDATGAGHVGDGRPDPGACRRSRARPCSTRIRTTSLAALEAIEARHGTVERYLLDELRSRCAAGLVELRATPARSLTDSTSHDDPIERTGCRAAARLGGARRRSALGVRAADSRAARRRLCRDDRALRVDASDVDRRIVRVEQTVPGRARPGR